MLLFIRNATELRNVRYRQKLSIPEQKSEMKEEEAIFFIPKSGSLDNKKYFKEYSLNKLIELIKN